MEDYRKNIENDSIITPLHWICFFIKSTLKTFSFWGQRVPNVWAAGLLHNEKKPEDQESLQKIFGEGEVQDVLKENGTDFPQKHKIKTIVVFRSFDIVLQLVRTGSN